MTVNPVDEGALGIGQRDGLVPDHLAAPIVAQTPPPVRTSGAPLPRRQRPGWVRRNATPIVGTLLAAALAGAVLWTRFRPVAVVVTPVIVGKAVDAVYATGTVEAYDRVNVKAKINGSIAELLVKEGQTVRKGDLLARIDNPMVSFDLKRGQADLSAAFAQAGNNAPQLEALRAQADAIGADLATARTDLSRSETLAMTGSVAQADLDRARSRVLQLQGQLASNVAQQRALRIDLNANAARQAAAVQSLATRVTDTEVRSPLDGVVLAKSVEIGEVVAVNQTLLKVGDTRDLILEVSVDEADVARVHEPDGTAPASRAAVSLYAFPREVFRGGRCLRCCPTPTATGRHSSSRCGSTRHPMACVAA